MFYNIIYKCKEREVNKYKIFQNKRRFSPYMYVVGGNIYEGNNVNTEVNFRKTLY